MTPHTYNFTKPFFGDIVILINNIYIYIYIYIYNISINFVFVNYVNSIYLKL